MQSYKYKDQFKAELVAWFENEKRDLPWRKTKDPYKIWVSEVMLQQTRVDTVIPYFNRFMEKYPTLQSLADAPEEELLKMWEGLGYYSRARNLQAGVREVVEKYDAKVPDNLEEISKLKGVGPYTAGAVLSIAYNVPTHAVDGNVMRVLSRVLMIEEDIALSKTRKTFEQAVMMLIDEDNPSSFNQGLMELGALICTPTSPKCLLCPVREYCIAFQQGDPSSLPVKSKKVKTKHVYQQAFVAIDSKERMLIERRADSGLLAGMWQFPMYESDDVNEAVKCFQATFDLKVKSEPSKLLSLKHVFSHLVWHIEAHVIYVEEAGSLLNDAMFVTAEELEKYPLPVPIQKIKQQILQEKIKE